jgi:hypothetical protein
LLFIQRKLSYMYLSKGIHDSPRNKRKESQAKFTFRPFRVVYQINTKNNYCKMFGNESNSANILHY